MEYSWKILSTILLYPQQLIVNYSPLIYFRLILLAYFCHVVQNHQAVITQKTPVYINICAPIISVEKKHRQRKKSAQGFHFFIFIMVHGWKKRTVESSDSDIKKLTQMLFWKVQKVNKIWCQLAVQKLTRGLKSK